MPKKPTKCQYCEKVLSSPRGRTMHEKVCPNNPNSVKKLFICPFCAQNFHTKREMNFHKTNCSGNPDTGPQVCPTCKTQLPSLQSLRLHEKTCAANKCEHCGSHFSNTREYKKHVKSCSGVSPEETCPHCSKKFKNYQALNGHLASCKMAPINLGKVHTCQFCSAELKTLTGKTNHEKICDSNPNKIVGKYPCKFCGQIFSSASGRAIHETSCLKNPIQPTKISCGFCEESYIGIIGLKNHMNSCNKNPNRKTEIKSTSHKISPYASGLEKSIHYFISQTVLEKESSVITGSIGKKELDILIPSKGIAVEINGTFWHSSYQYGTSPSDLANKTIDCEKKSIQLIHIAEFSWNSNRDLWKSVLTVVINPQSSAINRIAARKLTFKKFPNMESKQFLNENHLQGFRSATEAYGLFSSDGELISMMSFSYNRHYKCQELIRFASKKYTFVIGGAQKLWKNYQKLKPIDVISYARRDWSSALNNVYQRLGFEYLGDTGPGYQYVHPSKMVNDWSIEPLSRQTFQKHKLLKMIDEGIMVKPDGDIITEKTITEANGYYKFYDAGNLIYKYKAIY